MQTVPSEYEHDIKNIIPTKKLITKIKRVIVITTMSNSKTKVGFVKLHPDAVIPVRAKQYDAGYDLTSIETKVIPARGRQIFSTGLSICLPVIETFHTNMSVYAKIQSRSGLSWKQGIEVGAGTIDAGYQGCLKVVLYNHTDSDIQLEKGSRIAQLVIVPVFVPDSIELESRNDNYSDERKDGGFGSSGVDVPL